jgi:hypothetical protein
MSLERAKELINQQDWVNALQALEPHMEKYPNDPMGLFCLGQIMLETGKQSIAYPIYKLVTQIEPKRPEGWINMGKSAGELHFYDEEEACFRKALKIAKAQNNELAEFIATQNLGTCAVHRTEPDKAIHWAKKALEIKENNQSKVDLGFSYLMKFNFKDGWKNYNAGMGISEFRDIKQYGNEPEWDGSPGKRVIIYGEQGLGDQIAFSGAIKDARKVCKNITIHVNPKLEKLLGRSLICESHGYGPDDDLKWLREFDASCSMSKIQELFRDDTHKYTGKPFLVADPLRRTQWEALLKELGDKPKVGIAWTGGVQTTQKENRSTELENLLPLLSQDVTWVSLEYKDRSEEIKSFEEKHKIKIHDFSWATRTDDYDDTAALVAELDLVIAVPTSVVHLAGGLGVPCWCMLHPNPHFMFGIEGETMPLYNSVKIFRRKKGWDILESISENLHEFRRDNTNRARASGHISEGDKLGTHCHA